MFARVSAATFPPPQNTGTIVTVGPVIRPPRLVRCAGRLQFGACSAVLGAVLVTPALRPRALSPVAASACGAAGGASAVAAWAAADWAAAAPGALELPPAV